MSEEHHRTDGGVTRCSRVCRCRRHGAADEHQVSWNSGHWGHLDLYRMTAKAGLVPSRLPIMAARLTCRRYNSLPDDADLLQASRC